MSTISNQILAIPSDDIPCGCDWSIFLLADDVDSENTTNAWNATTTPEMTENPTATLIVNERQVESTTVVFQSESNATVSNLTISGAEVQSSDGSSNETKRLSDTAVAQSTTSANQTTATIANQTTATPDGAVVQSSTSAETTVSSGSLATTTALCELGCLANGTCTGLNTCTCTKEYTGRNCAYKQMCVAFPALCQNGGTCVDSNKHDGDSSAKPGNNTFECSCAPGYKGTVRDVLYLFNVAHIIQRIEVCSEKL